MARLRWLADHRLAQLVGEYWELTAPTRQFFQWCLQQNPFATARGVLASWETLKEAWETGKNLLEAATNLEVAVEGFLANLRRELLEGWEELQTYEAYQERRRSLRGRDSEAGEFLMKLAEELEARRGLPEAGRLIFLMANLWFPQLRRVIRPYQERFGRGFREEQARTPLYRLEALYRKVGSIEPLLSPNPEKLPLLAPSLDLVRLASPQAQPGWRKPLQPRLPSAPEEVSQAPLVEDPATGEPDPWEAMEEALGELLEAYRQEGGLLSAFLEGQGLTLASPLGLNLLLRVVHAIEEGDPDFSGFRLVEREEPGFVLVQDVEGKDGGEARGEPLAEVGRPLGGGERWGLPQGGLEAQRHGLRRGDGPLPAYAGEPEDPRPLGGLPGHPGPSGGDPGGDPGPGAPGREAGAEGAGAGYLLCRPSETPEGEARLLPVSRVLELPGSPVVVENFTPTTHHVLFAGGGRGGLDDGVVFWDCEEGRGQKEDKGG